LTAETEQVVAKAAAQHVTSSTKPTTAVAQQDVATLLERLPKLASAVEEEHKHPEDRFQALVCIGWLHWVAGQYDVAATHLPADEAFKHLESMESISTWTKVCALKSAYVKANCLTRAGNRIQALAQFGSAIRPLSSVWTGASSKKQLCHWSELFLTEYCMLFSQAIEEEHEGILRDPDCLVCFRSWANYWGVQRSAGIGGLEIRGSIPRRRIWLAYYDVLSELLKQDLPYPTGNAPAYKEPSARAQLRAELKHVESVYNTLLLSETEFPRANEERVEVERFVELVMENWKILNGRGWKEHDLGQGGKDALSRGILDILYSAATKTYHSTAILRYLYVVHLAVAEFDIAFKSFDSYFELVMRGKARVEKTGHPERSLDDDETVLETVSSCTIALCRYGDRQAAEKARHLATELERLLEKFADKPQPQPDSIQEEGFSPYAEGAPAPAVQQPVGLATLALSWQAIGLAHAQWARMTYDAASRSDIQKRAIQCLQKSLSSEYGRVADARGIFALGLLLAEQRELTTAIELVKTALLAEKVSTEDDLYHGSYWRERALVPLWHLLSLMLSTRQDYMMAARACEGAFEQFKDPSVLFGTKSLDGYRSEHLNEVSEAKAVETGGVVDDMDDMEKESILEVKMTQLALVELLEGPKVAVNASVELLALYSRLFGAPHDKPTFNTSRTRDPPKSSAGTLRSIKGSLFHRHGHGHNHERSTRSRHSMAPSEKTVTIRPQTAQTEETFSPPIAQTATTDAADIRRSRQSVVGATRGDELPGGKLHSLRKRESSGSRQRAASNGPVSHQPSFVDGDAYFTPYEDPPSSQREFFTVAGRRHPSSSKPPDSNSARKPSLAGIAVDKLEPEPVILPVIHFSEVYHTRRRTAILVQVWLMTAGFYRRAEMYEDAQAAIIEANKLVQGLEGDVSNEATGGPHAASMTDAGELSLRHAGWAGKKSVEELWGDVWAEVCWPYVP
jgi:tetratricopeptide (TPR) repeat protein